MRKEVYDGILRLVNETNQEKTLEIQGLLSDAIAWNNTKSVCLTIKEYKEANGLSAHVYNSMQHNEED